jgi:hypothetical protein
MRTGMKLDAWICLILRVGVNVDGGVLRPELERLGGTARKWLRRKVYPIDLILAGSVPPSQMYSFGLNEGCRIYPPVDVELEAWRLQ